MSNPIEHPAESDPHEGPQHRYQDIIDVHLDAIAAEMTKAGRPPIAVAIFVRCAEDVDEAGNDSMTGWYTDCEESEQADLILACANRLQRATKRVYAPELR